MTTHALPYSRPESSSTLAEIWEYRELLRHLTIRNLKVKYKRSVLGFVWTLLNPLLTIGALMAVFGYVVRIELPAYWAFLVSGYFVWNFVSMVRSAGTRVLVDRGWVPAAPDRGQLPALGIDSATRTVTGMVAPLPRAGLALGATESTQQGWPRRLLWPDAAAVQAHWGVGVPARIVLLRGDQADGFVREWTPATGMPPERHLGYAVQWFGLAIALVLIWLVLALRTRGKVDGQA